MVSTSSTWGFVTLHNSQALAALKAARSKVTSQVTEFYHCVSVLHRAISELQQTADNFVQTEVLCGLAVNQELAAISGPVLREQRGSLISPSKPSYSSLSILLHSSPSCIVLPLLMAHHHPPAIIKPQVKQFPSYDCQQQVSCTEPAFSGQEEVGLVLH